MKPALPVRCDIVLVGGGHSHVAVLRMFGMKPEPGVRLTLVARDTMTPYSGMLPGLMAGHYGHAEAHIDLERLSRFAGARLYRVPACGIDMPQRRLLVEGRPPVPFDLLSLDIGSTPSTKGIVGAAHAIPVKPVDRFLERWAEVEAAIDASRRFRFAVVGGGAGGVELALSLHHRLARRGAADGLEVAVVTSDTEVLPTHAATVRRRMRRALDARGIVVHTGRRVARIEPGLVATDDGWSLDCDATVLVTPASPAPWLADTGLALDERGFVRVRETLESLSHPGVFAAGDVAAWEPRRLEKSGVFAVRQGPVLADNLRRAATGRPLRPWRAQRRTLALISTGDPSAIASWGPVAVEGRWVWQVKDRIDRRFMRRYQELPAMPVAAGPVDEAGHPLAMRCGGCGAKVASPVLRRVLARLSPIRRDDVLLGLDGGDDAAVIAPPPGKALVQTVDQFRAFVDDPWLFGRIAANHCLGDLWAMGAEPQAALALVTLPWAPEDKLEDELSQLLEGALETLNAAGVALVGGHTAEGAELSFGLSLNGFADAADVMRKGGARPGDALILTKPLGTGAIFAADMRGEAGAGVVTAALDSMLRSNGPAAAVFRAHGASALTDVTGFGLLGHLIEMLRASGADAVLDLAAVPALPGARDLIRRGVVSSLHPANARFGEVLAGAVAEARVDLLYDPQTAGGLLAAVPAEHARACVTALQEAGDTAAAVIGRVTARAGGAVVVDVG